MRHRFAAVAFFAAACPPLALAQTPICDASGFPPADPVIIDQAYQIQSGCTIDFGAREVVVQGPGSFLLDSGTIKCAKLVMQTGSDITGSQSGVLTIDVVAAGPHDGSVVIAGRVDHDDGFFGGGVIQINCTGSFLLTGNLGRLRAKGTGFDADGGCVEVTAGGDITIDGDGLSIDVTCGEEGLGGDVFLDSLNGSVTVEERISADGGGFDGGFVCITAANDIDINDPVTADGGGTSYFGFGDGGSILMDAGGLLTLMAELSADGPNGTAYAGGASGGCIDLSSGSVMLIGNDIEAKGGIDSCGGDVVLTCGDSVVQQRGRIFLRGAANDAGGGTLCIDSTLGTFLFGDIFLDGASSDFGAGGTIDVVAGTDIIVNGQIQVDGNTAGCIDLFAPSGSITISGNLIGNGTGSSGSGADVTLNALTMVDLSGGLIDVDRNGPEGSGGRVDIDCTSDVIGDRGTRISAQDLNPVAGAGGVIDIRGCRLTFPDGSFLDARSDADGRIHLEARDQMTLGGRVFADNGTIELHNRLGPAVSPDLTGVNINPAPLLFHDPTAPPCLGALTMELTVSPTVPPGVSPTASVASVPSAPLLVLVALAPAYVDFGPLGIAQLDFGSAAQIQSLGVPAGATDGSGSWSFVSFPAPPGLAGVTLFFEAYAIDPGAANGLFHQSELEQLLFTP